VPFGWCQDSLEWEVRDRMSKDITDPLVVGGAALAGGAAGVWAGAKMGTVYGMRLGPWAAVAGAVIGAMVGAALSHAVPGDLQGLVEPESDEA
jgi:outer membrane lipoprotein SlyB